MSVARLFRTINVFFVFFLFSRLPPGVRDVFAKCSRADAEKATAARTSIIQKTTVINATEDDLTSAAEGGYESLEAKEDLEKNFPTIDDGTPSYRHQQAMRSGPESIRIARNAYVENVATEKLRSAALCLNRRPSVRAIFARLALLHSSRNPQTSVRHAATDTPAKREREREKNKKTFYRTFRRKLVSAVFPVPLRVLLYTVLFDTIFHSCLPSRKKTK